MFSVYLSMDAFFDWRQNMIITRFENSELPVTEIDFPAVTVCSQVTVHMYANCVHITDFVPGAQHGQRGQGRGEGLH